VRVPDGEPEPQASRVGLEGAAAIGTAWLYRDQDAAFVGEVPDALCQEIGCLPASDAIVEGVVHRAE
jgi:hypothetical protein